VVKVRITLLILLLWRFPGQSSSALRTLSGPSSCISFPSHRLPRSPSVAIFGQLALQWCLQSGTQGPSTVDGDASSLLHASLPSLYELPARLITQTSFGLTCEPSSKPSLCGLSLERNFFRALGCLSHGWLSSTWGTGLGAWRSLWGHWALEALDTSLSSLWTAPSKKAGCFWRAGWSYLFPSWGHFPHWSGTCRHLHWSSSCSGNPLARPQLDSSLPFSRNDPIGHQTRRKGYSSHHLHFGGPEGTLSLPPLSSDLSLKTCSRKMNLSLGS